MVQRSSEEVRAGVRRGRRAPRGGRGFETLEQRRMLSAITLATAFPVYRPTGTTPIVVNLRDFIRSDSAIGTDVRLDFAYGTTVVTGSVELRLTDKQTPRTATNFLNYLASGRFDGTFFHRLVPGFVLQGGNFTWDGANLGQATADAPVVNEFSTAVRYGGKVNVRGTLAMAKVGGDPNSATNQFFFNLADNSGNLDNQNGGFTTFGSVLGSGMDVIDAIENLPIYDLDGSQGSTFDSVPTKDLGNVLLGMNLVRITRAVVVAPWVAFSASSQNTGAFTTSVSGHFLTITPTGTPGAARIDVTAVDREGAVETFPITITSGTPSATITVANTRVAEGSVVTLTMTGASSPADGNVAGLKYSYDFDNNGVFEITESTSTTAVIPLAFTDGPRTLNVRVRVTDSLGGSSDVTRALTVAASAPVVTVQMPTAPRQNQSFTVSASATSAHPADQAGGYTFTWTISRAGATVGSGTGSSISFTPANAGAYTVAVTARDKDGATSLAAGGEVNVAAAGTPSGTLTVTPGGLTEGQSFTVAVINPSSPADGNVATLRYSFDLDGDGLYEVTNSTAGSKSQSTTDSGTRTVRVRITDTLGASAELTTVVAVGNVAPVATVVSTGASPLVGRAKSWGVSATDVSVVDAAAGYTFTWTMKRGGTQVATGTLTGPNGTVTYTPDVPGSYLLSVTATDKDAGVSAAVTKSFTAGANEPEGTLSVTPGTLQEGKHLTVSLTGATSPVNNNPATLRYSFDLDGDGLYEVTNQASFTRTVLLADSGTKTIRAMVTDVEGTSVEFETVVAVGNVVPVATVTAPTGRIRVGRPSVWTLGATDISAADTAAGLTLAWTISRGGNVVASGSGATITYTPDVAASYILSATATDKDGGVSTAVTNIFSAVGGAPGGTLTLSQPQGGGINEGQKLTVGVANPTSPINGITTTLVYAYDLEGTGQFTITNSPVTSMQVTLGDSGPRTLRVRITDVDGIFTDLTTVVMVGNLVPVAAVTAPTGTVRTGRAAVWSIGATDASAADVAAGFTYAWTVTRNGTSVATGTLTGAGSGSTISYTPDTTGAHVLSLTATDKDGGVSQAVLSNFTVQQGAPSGTLGVQTATPRAGSPVTVAFTNLVDPLGGSVSALTFAFDVDGDGVFSAATSNSSVTFVPGAAGALTVRGRVIGGSGQFSESAVTMQVAAAIPPPSGTLGVTTASPRADRPVTVGFSNLVDPSGGSIVSLTFAFDIDGDGVFAAATSSSSVTFVPGAAGARTVRARVIGGSGVFSESAVTFDVAAVPSDQVAPTASVVYVAPRPSNATGLVATILFRDDKGIDLSTVGLGNVRLVLPGGSVAGMELVESRSLEGGTVVLATYRFDTSAGLPGTGYKVRVNAGAGGVTDTSGNAVAQVEVPVSVGAAETVRAGGVDGRVGDGSGAAGAMLYGREARVTASRGLDDGRVTLAGLDDLGRVATWTLTAAGGLSGDVASYPLPGGFQPASVDFDTDGGFIVVGRLAGTPAVAKLNADGTLATGFGVAGMIVPTGFGSGDVISAARAQPDGRVLLAGRRTITGTGGGDRLFVTRLTAAGQVDTTFGVRGQVLRAATGGDAYRWITLAANGDIYVGGTVSGAATAQKLSNRGRNGSGWAAAGASVRIAGFAVADRAVLDASGRITLAVLAGASADVVNNVGGGIHLVRLGTTGRIDPRFGTGGIEAVGMDAREVGLARAGGSLVAVRAVASEAGAITETRYRREDVADIGVTQLTGPKAGLKVGATLSARFTLSNLGSLPAAGRFSARLVLSKDDVLGNSDDIVVTAKDLTLATTAAGAARALSLAGKVPAGTPTGAYQVFVQIAPPSSGGGAVGNLLTTNDLRLAPASVV